jgi:hypothetical protein
MFQGNHFEVVTPLINSATSEVQFPSAISIIPLIRIAPVSVSPSALASRISCRCSSVQPHRAIDHSSKYWHASIGSASQLVKSGRSFPGPPDYFGHIRQVDCACDRRNDLEDRHQPLDAVQPARADPTITTFANEPSVIQRDEAAMGSTENELAGLLFGAALAVIGEHVAGLYKVGLRWFWERLAKFRRTCDKVRVTNVICGCSEHSRKSESGCNS